MIVRFSLQKHFSSSWNAQSSDLLSSTDLGPHCYSFSVAWGPLSSADSFLNRYHSNICHSQEWTLNWSSCWKDLPGSRHLCLCHPTDSLLQWDPHHSFFYLWLVPMNWALAEFSTSFVYLSKSVLSCYCYVLGFDCRFAIVFETRCEPSYHLFVSCSSQID